MSIKTPIRVKVILDNFFQDHRQKAIVTIDKDWTIVKNLQSHIQSMFQIKKMYLTTADGFWFPPNECISVIFSSDTVVAHPKISTKTSKESENLNGTTATKKIKSIFVTDLNTFSTKLSANDSDAASSPAAKEPIGKESIDIENDGKKKRKRVRKRKLKNKMCESNTAESETPKKHSKWINDLEKFDFTDKSKFKKKQGIFIKEQPLKPKSHIWFSEDGKRHTGDDDEQSSENSDLKVEEKMCVDDEPFILPPQARVVQATYTEIDIDTEKIPPKVDAILENPSATIISSPPLAAITSSPINIDNKIVEKQSAKEETDTKTNETIIEKETAMEKMRKNIDSMSLPSLTDSPKINDVIAFKTLKLTETYEPTMSEYIIGMVQKIDNEIITLFVMAGSDQLKDPDGKFQLSNEIVSDDDNTCTNEVELRLSELLEPKICQL